jgi:hypothetical protein
MAWQYISPEVIRKGFRKCCISSAMAGTDDDMWNDSEEEDVKTVKMETLTLNGKGR